MRNLKIVINGKIQDVEQVVQWFREARFALCSSKRGYRYEYALKTGI